MAGSSDTSLMFGLEGANIFTDTATHTISPPYFWYQIDNLSGSDLNVTIIGNIRSTDGIPNKNESLTVTIGSGRQLNGYFSSVKLNSGSGLLCHIAKIL